MTRSCAKSWCAYGEWGEAHMGSAYDFNLLMYFLALRIGTRCLPGYHGPFVSPLSPLLALCLLFCLLLLLPAAAAWLGFLFCSTAESSWVLLFWKECESVWLPKSMSGDLGGQSPKIWFRTSFGPRLHLVRTSFKLQPVKTQPGEVLERLCNGLLLETWCLLLFKQEYGCQLLVAYIAAASELVHFDRRCANGISTWRKIIDVWRKQGAMRLAQVLVNGVGSRRGSGQRCFARLISH